MDTKYKKYCLLLSMSLGDGSIGLRKSKKGYLTIVHHEKHLDYLEYKSKLLLDVEVKSSINKKKRSSGNAQYQMYVYSDFMLGGIRSSLYGCNDLKKFNKKFFKHLNELSLAILWMDDGSINRQKKKRKDGNIYVYPYGDIATQSFDKESCENIIEWLKNNFGIDSRLHKSKSRKNDNTQLFSVRMNRDNLNKLVMIVKPYVEKVPSMLYKITV